MNSRLIDFAYSFMNPEKGEALAEIKKHHVEQLPVQVISFSDPEGVSRHDRMVELVERMLELCEKRTEIEGIWREWVETAVPKADKLTKEFRERGWIEVGLQEGWNGIKAVFQEKNAVPPAKTLQELRRETENSLEELKPLYERIEETDRVIDEIVYRLYNLTEEEISVIEETAQVN